MYNKKHAIPVKPIIKQESLYYEIQYEVENGNELEGPKIKTVLKKV